MDKKNQTQQKKIRSEDITPNFLDNQSELENVMKQLADVKYALDQSSIVGITNQKGIILSVNKKFCEISQYDEDELIGQNHRILNSNYHDEFFFKEMWRTISQGKTWRGEIRNRTKYGHIYWVDTTIVPLLGENQKPYRYISIRNDISQNKLIEQQIIESEEMFRFITGNSSDLILIIDPKGNINYVSPSHERLHKIELTRLHTIEDINIVNDTDRSSIRKQLDYMNDTKQQTTSLEFSVILDKAVTIDVKTDINSVFNSEGEISNFVLVTRDITEQKKHEETIHYLAYHDVLTKLPNRRHFISILRDEVLPKGNKLESFTILLINIDRFKYINDLMGHEIGDYILIRVAERIEESLKTTDHISRLGGDEFAVILNNVSDREEIDIIAQKLLDNIGESIYVANNNYSLSCSIGMSIFPEHGKKSDELLNNTDTALSSIKELGGGGYAFYSEIMDQKSLERVMLENQLKKAIELEQFYLDYQPKVNFMTEEVIGIEALVRWKHPDLGIIPPNNFISLAEETGQILPLGRWVLREACVQNKLWQEKGYPPLVISVNISVKQLMDANIVNDIKVILEETNLDPKWLEMEVTESTFANITHASALLEEIRNLGVQISIDDFGTGYSSFSYIKHLPIDTLKIDSSFIRDIHENKDSHAIVKAMLALTKTLGINVIAEGIELKNQATLLQESGCFQGQGYLFSKPLSPEHFETYIKNPFKK